MPLNLHYHGETTIPVELEGILPENLCQLSLDEIRQQKIFHGKEVVTLGEFFDVSGDASDEQLVFDGQLSGVHWIGAKMRRGQIVINGDAGRHLGSEMSGGQIEVKGHAGDWAGGEMHGGLIHVRGDAGHLIGAAYRGGPKGMTNGTIIIAGKAGNEVGHTMRRGLIAIGGDVGDLVGISMLAGSILVFGKCGIRHGVGMKRGTIAFLGEDAPQMLPTFRHACRYSPNFLRVVLLKLKQLGFEFDPALLDSNYDLYHGDLIEGGRGEVVIKA